MRTLQPIKAQGLALSVVMALACCPAPSLACSFDTDCEPGSHCVKDAGQIHGYCMGGMFPGNQYDRAPVRDPLDIRGTRGNTCSFDVDCGPGGRCVKSGLYGVCQ